MLTEIKKSLRRCAAAFRNDLKGAVAPLVGVSIMTLIAAVGVSVDTARLQMAQARLSKSLDSAGLAAGATVNTTDIASESAKYLNANYKNYMESTIITSTVTANSDNTTITLAATARVPMYFMKIFGKPTSDVSATAEVTRQNKGLELVMALDNTGSMAGSKLTSLKSAATDLVNILHGNTESQDSLWIGLVPFAQAVNVGSAHTSWLNTTHYNSLNWGPTSWGGCVDARASPYDTTEDTPTSQKFKAYYWPDSTSYNDWVKPLGLGYYSPLNENLGPNKYCSKVVTPMTASRNTIIAGINAMNALGNTHISEGAAWGWRMLSPGWRNLWGGEMNSSALPLDYNTPKMNKAIIIMTDGDNTISSSVRGAYGYLSDGTLGTTNQTTAETKLDQRLTTICTNMKNKNIYIYTISFGTITASSQTMLRNCATQAEFYFDSPDSATLQQAFHAIADSLSDLRVSK